RPVQMEPPCPPIVLFSAPGLPSLLMAIASAAQSVSAAIAGDLAQLKSRGAARAPRCRAWRWPPGGPLRAAWRRTGRAPRSARRSRGD
nr:hypothetical protein [Tanacetum cinerariifolium]